MHMPCQLLVLLLVLLLPASKLAATCLSSASAAVASSALQPSPSLLHLKLPLRMYSLEPDRDAWVCGLGRGRQEVETTEGRSTSGSLVSKRSAL